MEAARGSPLLEAATKQQVREDKEEQDHLIASIICRVCRIVEVL
jgi:hypothetical protein